MSKKLMPFKMAIYEYACNKNEPFSVDDVLRDLKDDYGAESQFKKKRIDEYLRSFLGIKFLKEENLQLDKNGELTCKYMIMDYGKTRMRFIPKH